MSFQNEEGIPLVSETEHATKTTNYPRTLLALFCAAVLAATAYTSYSFGKANGIKAMNMSREDDSLKVVTTLKQFDGDAEHLPNDADGPLTNDGALRSIVHHNFGKYKYLEGKQFDAKFKSAGHGYALDGSPIPDSPDYESQEGEVEIHVGFFGGVFKKYWRNGEHVTDKLGEMTGLNKEDDIVFTGGDSFAREGVDLPLPHFGIVQVICGETDKIADYHMHSGHDNRITIHSIEACDHDN